MTHVPRHSSADQAPRQRRWPWWLVGCLVIATPLALFAWDGYHLANSAGSLQTSASAAQQAVADREASVLSAQVADLQAAADTFASHSDGWHWELASHVPWVQDQTVPVQQVGQSLKVIADDALGPLADMGDLSALEAPPVSDGRIDPFVLEPFRAPLAQASSALETQSGALAEVETAGTIEPISSRYLGLEADLAALVEVVGAAHVAAELLPTMLGGEGARTYALMVQNNAEPRTSGGIPGAVLEVTVDDGRLSIGQYIAASAMSDPANPVAALTDDEERVFSTKMAQYAQDVNFTPEFPRAAELMAAFWKRETGVDVDGVLSIDPVAMGYMLEGMQPTTVEGIEITAESLSQVLLSDVYWAYDDPRETDGFFALAARELFGQLLDGQTSVMDGAERAIDEHRFAAWSRDSAEQALLASMPVGAQWVEDRTITGVYMNDASGSKIGYYVDQEIEVARRLCGDGTLDGMDVTVRLTHTFDGDVSAMPDYVSGGGVFVPEGQFAANVLFFPSEGHDVLGVMVDGEPAMFSRDIFHTRPMGAVRATVEPGETTVVAWSSRGDAVSDTSSTIATPLARPTDVVTVDPTVSDRC